MAGYSWKELMRDENEGGANERDAAVDGWFKLGQTTEREMLSR